MCGALTKAPHYLDFASQVFLLHNHYKLFHIGTLLYSPIMISEGGQSSTGSVLSWARRLFSGANDDPQQLISYAQLDQEVGLHFNQNLITVE